MSFYVPTGIKVYSYVLVLALFLLNLYSFYPDAIKIWNHLPDHLTMTTDIDAFRKDIINYIT